MGQTTAVSSRHVSETRHNMARTDAFVGLTKHYCHVISYNSILRDTNECHASGYVPEYQRSTSWNITFKRHVPATRLIYVAATVRSRWASGGGRVQKGNRKRRALCAGYRRACHRCCLHVVRASAADRNFDNDDDSESEPWRHFNFNGIIFLRRRCGNGPGHWSWRQRLRNCHQLQPDSTDRSTN